MPINDEPASDITDRTSAKSTFTKPGTCKPKNVRASDMLIHVDHIFICNCHTGEYAENAYVKNVSISRPMSFKKWYAQQCQSTFILFENLLGVRACGLASICNSKRAQGIRETKKHLNLKHGGMQHSQQDVKSAIFRIIYVYQQFGRVCLSFVAQLSTYTIFLITGVFEQNMKEIILRKSKIYNTNSDYI